MLTETTTGAPPVPPVAACVSAASPPDGGGGLVYPPPSWGGRQATRKEISRTCFMGLVTRPRRAERLVAAGERGRAAILTFGLPTRHETDALGARAALVDAEACARAMRIGCAPERDAAMQISAGRSDRAGAVRAAVPAVVAHPRSAATVGAADLIRGAAGRRAARLALRSEVAVDGEREAHLAGAAVGVDLTSALFARRDAAPARRSRARLAHALVAAVTPGLSRRPRASNGLRARRTAGLDGTIGSRRW